ncbi:Uncharacterised protein [BD1-7 clade bacterium]|uniref:Hemolysin n=1 Tax=BD1-7 clade bacterium TaxID=2029982 RepID=A0A5S9PNR3_9GAMM|nr:Uncharacterised protein [BD1-7 clade bacterium]CAA0105716.1 Uncharacterised protein [BD1-7 clade bacterium]
MKPAIILACSVIFVAACSKSAAPPSNDHSDVSTSGADSDAASIPLPTMPNAGKEKMVGMANPASVFCEDQRGKLVIITEGQGQAGYCHFKDGSICEEWAFYRKECQIGDSLKQTP